jgi:hypothetical protein
VWLEHPIIRFVLFYRNLRYGYTFRTIPLTQGKYALVDPEDYERLAKYKWHANKGNRTYYAMRWIPSKKPGRYAPLYMHRQVLNYSDAPFIDHINHNGLDNRKTNIRPATRAQNNYNRQKYANNSYSKYKGVSFKRKGQKWFAQIGLNNKMMFLGYFKNEIEAAKEYDKAARKYHGKFASLNFEK